MKLIRIVHISDVNKLQVALRSQKGAFPNVELKRASPRAAVNKLEKYLTKARNKWALSVYSVQQTSAKRRSGAYASGEPRYNSSVCGSKFIQRQQSDDTTEKRWTMVDPHDEKRQKSQERSENKSNFRST